MRSYSLIAPAKINLYLEIIGSRSDGYHELAMILQSIDLSDQIDIHSASTENIRVYCNHPQVPTDQTNLVYKAAILMAQEFPKAFSNFGGVDITIKKYIPVAAGLAGGSSNAAAVLVGMVNKNTEKIVQELHNDLEKVVLPAYPQVWQLRELFASQPEVLGTMMSGSGPSVFAIVESRNQGEIVKQRIRKAIPDEDLELFVTHTIKHGIKIA